ncbi:hypothetical protein TrST_g9316 [Triparma strigata]|uniref:Uncharacterized protein n=1 Tax=Triparma strigata TaxID=1606541 RepID=A0A9W7CAJ4_9STRA|nr:hypothetical protein TrST_g9316 [Triparma strigata]
MKAVAESIRLDEEKKSIRLGGDNICPVYCQVQGSLFVAEAKTVIHSKPMSISRVFFDPAGPDWKAAHSVDNRKSNPLVTIKKSRQGSKECIVFMVKQCGQDLVEFLLRFSESTVIDEDAKDLAPDSRIKNDDGSKDNTKKKKKTKKVITIASVTEVDPEWSDAYHAVRNNMINVKKLVKTEIYGRVELSETDYGCSACTMTMSMKCAPGMALNGEEMPRLHGSQKILISIVRAASSVTEKAASALIKASPGKVNTNLPPLRPTGFEPKTVTLKQDIVVAQQFNILFQLLSSFDRSAEVDRLRRSDFLRNVASGASKLSDMEVVQVKTYEGIASAPGWVRESGCARDAVESFTLHHAAEDSIWHKRVATVDENYKDVFASIFDIEGTDCRKRHNKHSPNSYYHCSAAVDGFRGKFLQHTMVMPGNISQHLFSSYLTYDMTTTRDGRESCSVVTIPKAIFESMSGIQKVFSVIPTTARKEEESEFFSGEIKSIFTLEKLSERSTLMTFCQNVVFDKRVPKDIVKKKIEVTMSVVNQLKATFERNRAKVDTEVNDAMASMLTRPTPLQKSLTTFTNDQQELVNRVFKIQNSILDGKWELVRPFNKNLHKYPVVDIMLKEKPLTLDTHITTSARAKGFFDCRPENAVSHFFDARSYFHREFFESENDKSHDTARLVIKSNNVNDQVVAHIEEHPFTKIKDKRSNPLARREFVFRQVMGRDEASEMYFVAMESVDDDVDYGLPAISKLMRSRIKGKMLFIAEPDPQHPETRSIVTLLQELELGLQLTNKKQDDACMMVRSLSIVGALRQKTAKDRENDLEDIAGMAKAMREDVQSYNGEELVVLEHVKNNYKRTLQCPGGFKPIKSPAAHIKMDIACLPGESNYVGRGRCVFDTDIYTAAAYEFEKKTRASINGFYDRRGIGRKVISINPHKMYYHRVQGLKYLKISPRAFTLQGIWKVEKNVKTGEPNAMIIVYSSFDHPDFPLAPGTVRASSWTFWKFEKMLARRGIPQTRVTRVTQAKLGGFIPATIVNKEVGKMLLGSEDMRLFWDKSSELDRMAREEFSMKVWSKRSASYSDFEQEVIKSGQKLFAAFEKQTETGTGLQRVTWSSNAGARTLMGTRYKWGVATSKVKANLVDVLAYIWNAASDNSAAASADNIEHHVVSELSSHHQVRYCQKLMPFPYAPVDFLTTIVWKKVEDDTFMIVEVPHQNNKLVEPNGRSTRGKHLVCYKLTRIDENNSRLQMLYKPSDFGKNIKVETVGLSVVSMLEQVSDIQRYFMRLCGAKQAFKADGAALGDEICLRIGEGGLDKTMRMFDDFQAFKDLESSYNNFKLIIKSIVVHDTIHTNKTEGIEMTKLFNLSAKEAEHIGCTFVSIISRCTLGAVAVDDWLTKIDAMQQLASEYPWFTPAMSIVAQKFIEFVEFDLKLKLAIGAAFSLMETVFGAILTAAFLNTEGLESYGYAAATLMATRACAQSILYYEWNKKAIQSMGWKQKVASVLPSLLSFKQVSHAFAVCKGTQGYRDEKIRETGLDRILQILFQGVPLRVLTSYILMRGVGGEGRNYGILIIMSNVVSCLATALASTSINFEFDSIPETKRNDQEFSDYIPVNVKMRRMLYVVMLFQSLLTSVLRMLGYALLLTVGIKEFFIVTVADLALCLAPKIFEFDLDFFLPAAAFPGGSLLARTFMKLLTDHARIVEFRHPRAMGGMLWTINDWMGLAYTFVAVILFSKTSAWDEKDVLGFGPMSTVLATFIISLACLWVTSNIMFLKLVEREKRGIFFSRVTAKQFCRDKFFKSRNDQVMAEWTLQVNKSLWASFRKEVKDWCLDNWVDWEYDKPKWFQDIRGKTEGSDSHVIRKDFIPDLEALSKMREDRRSGFGRASSEISLNPKVSLSGTLTSMRNKAGLGRTLSTGDKKFQKITPTIAEE